MSSTLTDKAVVGRRVEFAYHRSLIDDTATFYHPGIITAITEDPVTVRVRLDGQRSNLALRPDCEGLRYLDQVAAVPELPMGRFHPTADDMEGEWEGVPVCSLGEDGDLVLLTDDPAKALASADAYRRDISGSLYHPVFDAVSAKDLRRQWAVFEWQPEDAECAWLMEDANEGDDMAIQLYYLYA